MIKLHFCATLSCFNANFIGFLTKVNFILNIFILSTRNLKNKIIIKPEVK